jgi:hypothetical protein
LQTSPTSREARPLDTAHINSGQLEALRNLLKKQSGEDVEFINIADARALTELGLAVRTQQGWVITEAGSRLLGEGTPPDAASSVTQLPLKPA